MRAARRVAAEAVCLALVAAGCGDDDETSDDTVASDVTVASGFTVASDDSAVDSSTTRDDSDATADGASGESTGVELPTAT